MIPSACWRGIVISKYAYPCTFSASFRDTQKLKTFNNVKKIIQQTNHSHTNAIDSVSVVQPPQFTEWSTVKYREMQSNLWVYFLIANLFCVFAVSNLSWGLFRPHKTCKQGLHWSPWPRPLFFLLFTNYITKLQEHLNECSELSESVLLLLPLVAFITQSGKTSGEHTENKKSQLS